MAWFRKEKKPRQPRRDKLEIPRDTWVKCEACGHTDIRDNFERNLNVCPNCDYHRRIRASDYLSILLDEETIDETESDLRSTDPLSFPDYPARLKKSITNAGDQDAVITATGRIAGMPLNVGAMDFAFMGGSMGSVVGEKLTRLIETATERGLPVIIISASGGARMYEGMFSLMQMAKTCGALALHSRARLPYISVLTYPTTAGVMASYASVGDLIIAEPGAMIGFAGPRVIKDTTQAELPPGFQTAEFLVDHGLIDAIVSRKDMKERLSYYLEFLTEGQNKLAALG